MDESVSSIVDEFLSEHQKAYSQGFEEIYALEKINIKSLRRIADKEAASEQACLAPSMPIPLPVTESKGLFEQAGSVCFRQSEPIHVLDLPQQVHKIILQQVGATLGDLYSVSWENFKGLGQGHIDEIRRKLDGYMQESRSGYFEPLSFLRALVGTIDRKHLSLLLSDYGLEEILPLSTGDRAALKHLSFAARQEALLLARQAAKQDVRLQFLQSGLQSITERFLKPWIAKRQGLALQSELDERLEDLSMPQGCVSKVFRFISEIYFEGKSPFCTTFISLDASLFCQDTATALSFDAIIQLAKSYFYKPGLSYPFSALIILCHKELARRWEGYPNSLIERALCLSQAFRVRKGEGGDLIIRRS